MLLTILLLAQVMGLAFAELICRDVTYTISGSAANRVFLVEPDLSTFEGAIKFLTQPEKFQQVNGTETIKGQWCLPQKTVHGRGATVQLLLHGNTYDKTYWTGLGSQTNSWVEHFTAEGYHVLNIDRVGSGASSHPRPDTHVQAPYQVDIIAGLIKKIRDNGPRIGMFPPRCDKVIVVGHSYGSILGNQLAVAHPELAAGYVLTGIAIPKDGQFALPGQLKMEFVPAAVHDPKRFPNYDPGYLTTGSKEGRRDTFYGGPDDYSSQVYDTDFATEGTITTGEALTQRMDPAMAFTGPVFILTGREDATFCGNGARSDSIPNCGNGKDSNLYSMKALFPHVLEKDFGIYVQEHAGHCNGLHNSAISGFKKTQAFLQRHGF